MGKAIFRKDEARKTITVERSFAAPLPRIWEAWTTSDLLEKWWAPKPYRAVTGSFDFKVGGHWHYSMLGPDGTKSWCWASYESVDPEKSYSGKNFFCDEQGKRNPDLPGMHWDVAFLNEGATTKVVVTITFASKEDMDKIIAMGFEEGFTMGLNQLEEVLA